MHDFKAFKIGFAVANRASVTSVLVEKDSTNPPIGSWTAGNEVYPAGSNFSASALVSNAAVRDGGRGLVLLLLLIVNLA